MADPTKYEPSYNFSDFQAHDPVAPLPGTRVDIELQNIRRTTSETIEAVKDIRRSDGKLANQSVGPDQLSPSLSLGFTNRGNWVTGQIYAAGDGVVYDNRFYSARVTNLSSLSNAPGDSPETWAFLFSVADLVIPNSSIGSEKITDDFSKALPQTCATRIALAAVDPARTGAVYLSEIGREGLFLWRTGDYGAQIAADTAEGIYIKADDIVATDGAWVRTFDDAPDIAWWGDGTDDFASAFTGFISLYGSSGLVSVRLPKREAPYQVNSAVTVPENITVVLDPGASLAPGHQLAYSRLISASGIDAFPGQNVFGTAVDQHHFGHFKYSGDAETSGGIFAGPRHDYELIETSQNIKAGGGHGSYAFAREYRTGGDDCDGGFVGGGFSSTLVEDAPNVTSDGGNIGVLGYAMAFNSSYGGTLAEPKGSIFGANFYGRLTGENAVHFINVTAAEFNTECGPGTSVAYKSGVQIVGIDSVKGYEHDAMLALSNKGGSAGWDHGILIGPMNGQHPIATTGTILGVKGTSTVDTGIDFRGYTFNGAVLLSNAVALVDGALILGNDASATRFIDARTGGATTYNTRIQFNGGNGDEASGEMAIVNALLRAPAIVPLADAAYNLGGASLRYNTVYASNGTINTSDEREKRDIVDASIESAEIRAIDRVKIKRYRWREGGPDEKLHFGVIAQEIIAAFEAEGLDALEYGLVQYDEWDDQFDGEGNLIVPAGSRYSVNISEVLALKLASL